MSATAPRPHALRDARPEDREAVRAATLAAFEQYAAVRPALWPAYRDNILATLAGVAPAEQIVADEGGRVVGAVLLYPRGIAAGPAPADPEVRLLAVVPEARGRGVAEALMRECIRRARQAGAPAIALHTSDVMQAAVRLYLRLGFARAPELDFEPVPGATATGYRLALR